MARQQQKQATTLFNEGQGALNTSTNNSNALYNSLFPQFSAEATNPQGFTPGETASMDTAAQQSVGGSTAGAVGQGNLTAARTRNTGGLDTALDASVRSGQQALSEDALGVQNENAMLKQQQKQEGLEGLSSLYGTNMSSMLSALGLGNQSVTYAGTNAGNSGWFQNLTSLMGGLGNLGRGAGAVGLSAPGH